MFLSTTSLALAVALMAAGPSQPAGPGISEALATARAAAITDLHYELALSIPVERTRAVAGRVTLRFTLATPQAVVVDFAQPKDRVRAVRVGGRRVEPAMEDEHFTIPVDATRAGVNEIVVEFVSGDEALNRNDDFLYTLFVPARAHYAFPCFDQPSLKGRYTLTLLIPDGWQVVANAPEAIREMIRDPSTGVWGDMVSFVATEPIPTYLVGFAAGRFSVETAERAGRSIRMFHRETDAAKVVRNREAIFDLHATSLAWLERYTGIAYPFRKLDIVLLPSFQFGGMEHPGAIFYNAPGLFLDPSATQNQMLGRAAVIAHETAHMWFGDLVTMRWFDDVWMKEVFANVMAAKIVNPAFADVNHELRFLLDHYPAAYQIDRTEGANPIRQPLANLSEAGQLYGAIIYQKAPVVMRQLELIVGEEAFRDGLREYLTRYAFGNATWSDLIGILDARTPEDLTRWSRAWVTERGRPSVTTSLRVDRAGRIASLAISQADPLGRAVRWPQRLRVVLGYDGATKAVDVYVTGRTTLVRDAVGLPRPAYVLPNGGGIGYGLFTLDERSRDYLLRHIEDLPDVLTRGSAWVTLWDNLLEGRVSAAQWIETALRALPHEVDEQNTQRVLAYTVRAFWKFLPPQARARQAVAFEQMLRAGLDRATTASRKAAWFNTLRDVASTPETVAWLSRVWQRTETVPGLPLAEADEITLAFELAVRAVPGWAAMLDTQSARIQNPDRQARFAFVRPALSADPALREAAFARFADIENRRREPWVLESLRYLNHPLREAHARRFVRPALERVREIQKTGDIFFPTRWMEATLSGHRSPEMAAEVRGFLAREKAYPTRLRWTVLSTADELFRAARETALVRVEDRPIAARR